MAKIKSELQELFQADGILNSENLEEITIEHEDGIIDLAEILKKIDGKYVKISITATDGVDIPFVKE